MKARSLVLVFGGVIGTVPVLLTASPAAARFLLAALLVIIVALISVRRPDIACVLTLALLPLLALVRRWFVPMAGWSSYDPLLLVAPVIALLLLHRRFVLERRSIAKDLGSKMVLGLILLAVLESVNPESGNIKAGVVGLFFVAAPLIWFFVGREFADHKVVLTALTITVIVGTVVAGYGLWQTAVGLPSWDLAWLASSGYVALNVLGTTRPFASFSSSAEYAAYLGIAVTVAMVAVLYRRKLALLAVPLLAYALFLSSVRSIAVLSLVGLVLILGLRTGSLRLTVFALGMSAAIALGTSHFFGAELTAKAASSGNPLIAHQVGGILNPFDPDQSTLVGHEQIVLAGVVSGLQHPLGLGTAATNLAGMKLGALTADTEIDISNAFVGMGLLGGLLFLGLVVGAFWWVIHLAVAQRSAAAVAIAGILIVTLGHWLNGGYYAVAPLIWFLVGWANRAWIDVRLASKSVATTEDDRSANFWNESLYDSTTGDAARVSLA